MVGRQRRAYLWVEVLGKLIMSRINDYRDGYAFF
jgi:hypothetical protein